MGVNILLKYKISYENIELNIIWKGEGVKYTLYNAGWPEVFKYILI